MKTIVAVWFLCAGLVCAQQRSEVVVSKGGRAKQTIDLSALNTDGEAGRLFRSVLEADLKRSGYFVMGSPASSALRLTGAASGALSVQCGLFQGAQPMPIKGAYRTDEKGVRKLAHQLADEIIETVTGKPGMNHGRIALIGKVNGRKELFVADCDGANMRQITKDRSISLAPYISVDGRRVVYTSFISNFPGVYVIDLIEGRRSLIAKHPGSNLSGGFSPDGGRVAMIWSKDGNPELYVTTATGQSPVRLTRTDRGEASPSWSPDGSEIVYVSDQGGSPRIHTMSRSGGAPRRLSVPGSQNVAPEWGPNGWIVCSSSIGGRFQITVVHPATGEAKQLTSDGYDYEDPTWAPDGRHVLCARSGGGRSALVLVDMLGDPPFPLTTPQGDWYSPSWSRE